MSNVNHNSQLNNFVNIVLNFGFSMIKFKTLKYTFCV